MNWFRMIDLPGNSCRFDGIVPEFGIGSVLKGGGIHHNVISYRFFLSIDCFFLFVFFWVSNQTKKNGRGRFFFFLFLFFCFPGKSEEKKRRKQTNPQKKKEKILEKKTNKHETGQGSLNAVSVFFLLFFNFSFFKKNLFFFLSRSIGSPIRSNKNSVKLGKKKRRENDFVENVTVKLGKTR